MSDEITYDNFGNVLSETNPTSGDRFKFTARELDAALSLYYYRARWYDPQAGRFLREDPLSFTAGDTNLYRYVFNNPVIYTDPTGLWTWKGAFGGLISGIFVGAGVGAGAGTWLAGIGAIPGAIAGGISGGIFGFVAGGIWGDSVGQATGTGDFTGGALCGVGGGVAGGLLGPIIWSIYTGVFWTSNFAIWLGLGAAPATQEKLYNQLKTYEAERDYLRELWRMYARENNREMTIWISRRIGELNTLIDDLKRQIENISRAIENISGRQNP